MLKILDKFTLDDDSPTLREERIERQELYCHECGRYVQFPLDLGADGNYTIKCPNCGHPHLRVIRDGKITETRWGSANMNYTIPSTQVTSTTNAATNSSNYGYYGGYGSGYLTSTGTTYNANVGNYRTVSSGSIS